MLQPSGVGCSALSVVDMMTPAENGSLFLCILPGGYVRGVWKRLDFILDGLGDRGFRVLILSQRVAWSSLKEVILGGRVQDGRLIEVAPPRILSALDALLHNLIGARHLALVLASTSVVRRLRPHYIFVSNEYWCAFFFTFIRNIFSPASAIVFDMPDLLARLNGEQGLRQRFNIWMNERVVPRSANGVIVLTPFAREYLHNIGVAKSRLCYFGELSDGKPARQRRAQASPALPFRLIWIGYLRPYYVRCIEAVVHELALMKMRDSLLADSIFLYVVGPFANREDEVRLKELVQRERLPVAFTGYLPWEKALDLMLDCDFGLQPLLDESALRFLPGMKVADYVAAGLPIICSNACAKTELLKGNYVSYDPGTPGSLAALLSRLPEVGLRKLAGHSIQIATSEFSEKAIDAKLDNLVQFVRELAGSRNGFTC